jgi:predicted transcriptional regulator
MVKQEVTKLELLRRSAGLTITNLSDISGVSAPVIIKVEKGCIDNVNVGSLRKLARALSCGVEDFF